MTTSIDVATVLKCLAAAEIAFLDVREESQRKASASLAQLPKSLSTL
jgi:hypothetical protein